MAKTNFIIKQGKTFSNVIRYESPKIIYHDISSITKSAPVKINFATNHPFIDGQRVAITGVQGMKEINALTINPVDQTEYKQCKIESPTQISINEINSSSFKDYKSGGVVQGFEPVNLTGAQVRFMIKDRVGGNILFSSLVNPSSVSIDLPNKITLSIDAVTTAGFTFTSAVYEVEVENSADEVTQLLIGNIKVEKEIAV